MVEILDKKKSMKKQLSIVKDCERISQIKDLTPTSNCVNIRVKLIEKFQPQYAGGYRVLIFTASDSTGQIHTLFRNNDIDAVEVGDIIEIQNGYIRICDSRLQLNIKPYGNFQIIESKK